MALPVAGIASILANSPRAVQILQGLGILTGGTIAAGEAKKQLENLPEGSLQEAYQRVFLGPSSELINKDLFKPSAPTAQPMSMETQARPTDQGQVRFQETPSGLVLGPDEKLIEANKERFRGYLKPPAQTESKLFEVGLKPGQSQTIDLFPKEIKAPPATAGKPLIESFPIDEGAKQPIIMKAETKAGKETAPATPAPTTEKEATQVFRPNPVDLQRIQDLAPTTQLPGVGPLNFLAKDKNSKQYIEATNPVKIFGEADLKAVDYRDKLPAPITYKFNPDVYEQVYTKSLDELNSKVNVDIPTLTEKFGMKAPDINLVNQSLEAAADPNERYWYQKSGEYLKDLITTVDPNATPQDVSQFIDIVSLTSGGVEPKQNLKLALGVYSDLKQNQPIETGFRTKASLDKYLENPESAINSPKFGNFTDTMKYFAGVSDRQPNVVNDLQMAKLFNVKPDQLASNPELYNAMTSVMNGLTEEVNKNLPEGVEKLQPFELQSLMWSQSRGLASNYQQVGEQLIQELNQQGIDITKDVMTPGFSAKLQKTIEPFQKATKATIEVGSFLTPAGQEIEKLINQYGDNPRLANDIDTVHKRYLNALITKPKGKPSLMEDAISNVIGEKASVSRMETGLGSFEGKVNYNVRIPLTVNTSKGVRELNPLERRQLLALIGKNLNQAAMAGSSFRVADGNMQEGEMETGTFYAKAKPDPKKINELEEEAGIQFNVRPVSGGFVGEIISFTGTPDADKINKAFEKVFGKDKKMTYTEAYWKSDYVENNEYEDLINGIEKGVSGGMEETGSTRKFVRNIPNIEERLSEIDKARDADYTKITNQPYIKKLSGLTKENLPEADRPTFKNLFNENALAKQDDQAYQVTMTPDQYLSLARKIAPDDSENTKERTQRIKDAIKKGNKIEDYPYLYIKKEGDNFVVTGEEGRHRALVLKELGVKEMPVMIKGRGSTEDGVENKRYTTPATGYAATDPYAKKFAGYQPKSIISDKTAEKPFQISWENLTTKTKPAETESEFTIAREIDPKLIDELLKTRGGIKGFQESMKSSMAPLPPSTKRQMFIQLNDKIMAKYGFDKTDKDPETMPPEELKKLQQKYFAKQDGIDYIASAIYDVIGGPTTYPGRDTIFALDDEGLPVAAVKLGTGDIPYEGRQEAIVITEAGSLFPKAFDQIIQQVKAKAKEQGKKFIVAEDLTTEQGFEALKRRGFKPTTSKKYKKFEGKLVRRPGGGRKVKQKNLVLEIE